MSFGRQKWQRIIEIHRNLKANASNFIIKSVSADGSKLYASLGIVMSEYVPRV